MTPPDSSPQIVREWLAKAQNDLGVAERALDPPPYPDLAAFLSQQAIEKVLKGYLTWHGILFQKTHDLEGLVGQCQAIDPTFQSLAAAEQAHGG